MRLLGKPRCTTDFYFKDIYLTGHIRWAKWNLKKKLQACIASKELKIEVKATSGQRCAKLKGTPSCHKSKGRPKLVFYTCVKKKAAGKHLCCGFPIECFHCFSQRLRVCASARASSSPHERLVETQVFSVVPFRLSADRWYFTRCFHSPGTCYRREPLVNVVDLVKQQVPQFPPRFHQVLAEGMRESRFPTNSMLESCLLRG